MDDRQIPQDTSRAADTTEARARRFRSGLVAAGAAAGMTIAGLGVAAGQTDGTTTPESRTTAPPAPAPSAPVPAPPVPGGPPAAVPGGAHHRLPGPDDHRGGMGPGIHGEFTTGAPGGGYQTVATQKGEVTAVSASSITVKSEDGFSRTYGVDDDTMVNAGNEGIADVAAGDQVHVTALVADGKANAVMVHDATQSEKLHQRWAPAHPPRPAAPGTRPGAGATTTPTT